MMKIMNVVAMGTAMALAAVSHCAFAQDDLDDLLKDLEGEAKAAPAAKQEESTPSSKAPSAVPAAEVPAKPTAKASASASAETVVPAKVAEPPASTPVAAKAPVKQDAVPAPAVAEATEKAAAKTQVPAPVVKTAPAPVDPDAELLANIRATEQLRRRALDQQAGREIAKARGCMDNGEYAEAVRHYTLASKLLNDRSGSQELRKECEQGIAEGHYRDALQEEEIGRHEIAVEKMTKAVNMRHPKARRELEKWNSSEVQNQGEIDLSEIKHRRNDSDYKEEREQIRTHLRRSRQYLAVRDMGKALEEVEVVLVNDPYNQEAIRLRGQIQKKRQTIVRQEREAARDGMIADVDEAWRPVYAVNAAQLKEVSYEIRKKQVWQDDPERTQEQDIERRMKEMRLPTISIKPPATIMDAVEYFRQASKDYDRPDIPLEKRGFNFVLKTPQPLKTDAGKEPNGFGGDDPSPANGLAPIPTITASDITFYEALKLVCDSVDYKFIVRGPVVMVMHKDMSTAELLSRKYDVNETFIQRVEEGGKDAKEKAQSGFGNGAAKRDDADEEENLDSRLRAFFEQVGVKWPEGASITYIKALGKLYVRNTRENLAEFEKILEEMGSQGKLIEIETRFVEVSQEDLNSLGFEWILNSDYSLNIGNSLGKALGIQNGTWGSESGSKSWSASNTEKTEYNNLVQNGKPVTGYPSETTTIGPKTTSSSVTYARSEAYNSKGANWVSNEGDSRNLGINAFGGTGNAYGNGNRYLSTMSNHISGESKSTNDQFMRVNAFLGTADLSMILHMLSQRSDTDLLSAPKVVTKSGENAVIKVVTEYIYPQDYDVQLQSSSSSSSGTSGGSSSAILAVVEPQNFTMREVGVILDVTPTYSEANGGTIDLELKPSVVEEPTWKNYGMKIPFTGNPSNGNMVDPRALFDWIPGATEKLGAAIGTLIDAQADTVAGAYMDSAIASMNPSTITYYDAPMEQPFFSVRSVDSKVSITPGATVVMGGLITEQRKAMDDKVPFLGDLPFIGRIFRSHAEQTIKRNLLIFVTGRLITPSGREVRMNEETTEEAEVKAAPKAE